MPIFSKISHLRQINSVQWSTLLRALIRLYPDYFNGKGISHSFVNITLELTYRCCFACEFCFLKDNLLNSSGRELTREEISGIVETAAAHGLSFFLTGGEPFLRADCEDIIAAIKRKGLKAGVNTNLYPLNEKRIASFGESGPDYIISSLHGPEKVHNAVTGRNSWKRVLDNLRLLRKQDAKMRLLINNVITRENLPYLEDIVRIARDFGVNMVTFQHESFLSESERAKHDRLWERLFGEPPAYVPSNQVHPAQPDMAGLIEAKMAVLKSLSRETGVAVFFKPALCGAGLRQWYSDAFFMDARCSYLYTDIRINPYGDVLACQPLPCSMGNIREKPLLDIANGEKMAAFRKNIRKAGGLYPGCARCCKLYRRF